MRSGGRTLRVLSVASEIYPLIKTGGLADVVGALPGALARKGVALTTLVPGYRAVLEKIADATSLHQFSNLFGGPARLLAGTAGSSISSFSTPRISTRGPGTHIVDRTGRDWPDNAPRFAALARVAADIGLGLIDRYRPAVIHAHDWQTGLTPAYLHYARAPRPGTVITVHNLAFQGHFPAALLPSLMLPSRLSRSTASEYFGGIGFLKAGLQFADRITTVSPTYAAEIRTPEGGMALDGLLRVRSSVVSGILNGIDDTVWNPASDPHLAATYTRAAAGSAQRRTRRL